MKKTVLFALAFFISLSFVSAINLDIERASANEVIIMGLDQPAIYSLNITNNGNVGSFDVYNLIGFNIQPKNFSLESRESKTIDLTIYPRSDLNQKGFFTFEYYIKDKFSQEVQTEMLTLKLIELNEAFTVGSDTLSPETNSIEVYIQNIVNFNFNQVHVKFKSAFFELDQDVSLKPYEKKSFKVALNKEDFDKLIAGFYTLNADITFETQNTNIEGIVEFEGKDILTTTESNKGLVLNTHTIRKTNEGNVVVQSAAVIQKNIISRLFTGFSPDPDVVERDGFTVRYTWNMEVKPGEYFEIIVRTNWLIPLLIIFFVVMIVFFAKQYSKTDLLLRKRVSFVRAKGGEFALKVSIIATAKTFVDRVNVIDKLPPLMKIYHKFGGVEPTKIDEKLRRVEWDLGGLEPGETRVLSYVVYSRLGVTGKFALSRASAIYEKEGSVKETESNRAFFITEQKIKDEEEN